METETREIPAVAARIVAELSPALAEFGERLRAAPPRFAVTVGRGSSGAAAFFAKYLFEQRLGVVTASATPSLRSVYGAQLRLEDALVLAVSQSGRSPDIVEFCRSATGPGVTRLGLINADGSPLEGAVDAALPLLAGAETSVAATKSCVAAMLTIFGLAAHWKNDAGMIAAFARAPDVLARAMEAGLTDEPDFLDQPGPVFMVGRGAGLAIAKEAALKLKEASGIFSEAFSSAEFYHGPLALASPNARCFVFAQNDEAFDGLRLLAGELEGLNLPTILIRAAPADTEPALELLGMLTRFYLFANATALRRGRSPDQPPLIRKVTETR